MEYKYTNEKGEIEIIQPERWVWGVVYDDDTELHQFGSDGVFHRIGEIDQDRVKLATLYKLSDMSKRIDLPFQKGMKLVHKYRNIKPFYLDSFVKVYMFGYKLEGKHSFTFVLPDDRLIVSPVDNVNLELFNLKKIV